MTLSELTQCFNYKWNVSGFTGNSQNTKHPDGQSAAKPLSSSDEEYEEGSTTIPSPGSRAKRLEAAGIL